MTALEVLKGRVAAWVVEGEGPQPTPWPGLKVIRSTRPGDPFPTVYDPALCLVLQGAKEVRWGDHRWRYDPETFLVTSVHLPLLSRVVEASARNPYLSLQLALDPTEVLEVWGRGREVWGDRVEAALTRAPVSEGLWDALDRLTALFDRPAELALLGPGLVREALVRVLQSPAGPAVAALAAQGGASAGVARAIARIRQEYRRPLAAEALAREAGLSLTVFYEAFRRVTGLSPLQYQKALRLQAARALLAEGVGAAEAGFRVGYQSPSQFSREYARRFGAPPALSVSRLPR